MQEDISFLIPFGFLYSLGIPDILCLREFAFGIAIKPCIELSPFFVFLMVTPFGKQPCKNVHKRIYGL